MELLGKISLVIHILAGAITLLAGPFAIFYHFKNPSAHRIAGKLFFYAMLVVTLTAVGGYLKRPDVAFFQLLFGISISVLCGVLRGVRSIFWMKGAPISRWDWAYTALLGINSLWLVERAVYHFYSDTPIPVPILMTLFALGGFSDVWENRLIFRQASQKIRLDWMALHSRTMLGAFIASTTAFTVNAAHFLPWWAQWFGPSLMIIPVQIYFGKKIQAMKQAKNVLEVSTNA